MSQGFKGFKRIWGASLEIIFRCVLKILFYDFLQKYEISFRLLFV